jgi:protein-disulfide isomerase
VEQDMSEGRALGVTGTPTFFVNGRRLVGAQPVEAFRDAVRAALEEAGKS